MSPFGTAGPLYLGHSGERAKTRLRRSAQAFILNTLIEAHQREAALPNTFAYVALFAWPLVSFILFLRLPLEKAAIWSLLGGWLLLPSAMKVDVPLFPPLDKTNIPAITTFLLCWMKGSQSPAPPRLLPIYLLAFCVFLSPILSTLNNSYEIQIGDRSLPGYYPIDGAKIAVHNLILILPFLVGLRFLASDKARALLLKALPLAALCYSLPMLFEVRFSPQFHRWVYGYHPTSFQQQVRDSGYRPVVFLTHGLEAALFISMAVIAAFVVARARWKIFGRPAKLVGGYLAVLLVLCKTWGANIYAILAAPLVLLTSPRAWVRAAMAIALLFGTYPLLRTYDIVPVHRIMNAANSINPTRASSFGTRVKNEDLLLAKANEKPILGWGSWGRNRVYAKGTGQDISVTDGGWIMQYGAWGWFGYLSFFGLFFAAIFRARSAVRGPVTENSIVIGGLSLLVAINLLDSIPNSAILPFTFLAAGSVAGAVRVRSARKKEFPAAAERVGQTAAAT
jgi:hypothetical protein